jgi:hypothetical protein
MTRLRTPLARACLRFAPRSWRDRYGDEVLQLVEDAHGGIGDLADLALAGLRRRADELRGGERVGPRVNPWAAGIAAIAALVMVAPTALFIGMNLFGWPVTWLSGVQLPGDVTLMERLEWVPVLPVLALLIALAPAVRIAVRRDAAPGEAVVTLRVLPMPRWLLYATFTCGVVLAFVIAYGLSENLLEAMR